MQNSNDIAIALLRQSVEILTERVDSLLTGIEILEARLTKQEHWQSRLTGAWVAVGIIAGFFLGRGGL